MRSYKLSRLYVPAPLSAQGTVTLDKDQSHYIATVMRLKVGATVLLFNGEDGEWLAEITGIGKKAVSLTLKEQTKPQSTEPDLWLCFAPIKKARLDFIAQKATELGVSCLIPTMTRRTIVDRVKAERMEANVIEAAEQCERLNIPEVRDPVKLDHLLADWDDNRLIMFCDEDLSGRTAVDALRDAVTAHPDKPWAILIGPEGGFDDKERALIRQKPNCVTVALGRRVLRADTAAMAAISLWQAVVGDWR